MKIYSVAIASLLLSLNGFHLLDRQPIAPNFLSGNISLTLKNGLWKLRQEKLDYQDLTLDLNCNYGKCDSDIWGYAPKFNKEVDYLGSVKLIQNDRAIELNITMQIQSHPWDNNPEKAEYAIELIPKGDKLIGTYSGKYGANDRVGIRQVKGEVTGKITPHFPSQIPNSIPIAPQEHPRLIFRKSQLPQIKAKTKTDYGKIILDRLDKSLRSNIYYDGYGPNSGYHAAGHCFLASIDRNPQSAATAWQITSKSIDRPPLRLLEQASIVAGIALAYDLCYDHWDRSQRKQVTSWLATQTVLLVNGSSPETGWNGASWSNWSARARSATGLAALAILKEPDEFFTGNKYLTNSGDGSFGIEEGATHTAIFALTDYQDNFASKYPAEIFGKTLVDEQKGFYLFRDRWQDSNNFVASIYLKRKPLSASWSFPDLGSFRIWGSRKILFYKRRSHNCLKSNAVAR